MAELNVEHVLLFVIVAFLLYHLIGGCGCGGNGFRVGGQSKECNMKGLFNKEDGICECYRDYYGKSCEIYGVKCVDEGLEKLCGNDKKKSLVECGKCIDKNEKILLENGCTGDDANEWCDNKVLDNHTCDLGKTYSKDGDGVAPCLQCEQCNVEGKRTNSSCTIYNNTDCSLNINANMNATCTQSNGTYFERFNNCIDQTDCVYSHDMPLNNCVNISTYNAMDGKRPFRGKNQYNIDKNRYDICNNAEINYGSGKIFNNDDQKKACAHIGDKYNDIREGTCQYKKEFLGNKCTFLQN
jgi:hypothetical protein